LAPWITVKPREVVLDYREGMNPGLLHWWLEGIYREETDFVMAVLQSEFQSPAPVSRATTLRMSGGDLSFLREGMTRTLVIKRRDP
jgi:hypothetical protein